MLLLSVFLLHNFEEALAYGYYRMQSQAIVRQNVCVEFAAPDLASFRIALVIVSLGAAGAMGWAMFNPDRQLSQLLVKILAWIMLLNILIPHIPAAMLMGGYAPGLITAVALNLPISIWVLNSTKRTGWST